MKMDCEAGYFLIDEKGDPLKCPDNNTTQWKMND